MLADIDDECELEVQVRWLALARMKEILSLPPPSADDVSVAAQEERELQLHAAQSALANARRAKEQLARTGGMTDLSGVLREIAAFGTAH
jgi:hypothetical protein